MAKHNSLSKHVKPKRVLNTTATGTSAVNTSSFDTQNLESVLFIASLGACTDNVANSMKLQGSNDDAAFTDITDAVKLITTGANAVIAVEIIKPTTRYVRASFVRTGTYAIDSVIALGHGARIEPAVQTGWQSTVTTN